MGPHAHSCRFSWGNCRIQLSGGPPPRGMKGMGRQTIDTVTMQRPDVELEFLPLDATDEKELARSRSSEMRRKMRCCVSRLQKLANAGRNRPIAWRYALKCIALGEQNVTFTVTGLGECWLDLRV